MTDQPTATEPFIVRIRRRSLFTQRRVIELWVGSEDNLLSLGGHPLHLANMYLKILVTAQVRKTLDLTLWDI